MIRFLLVWCSDERNRYLFIIGRGVERKSLTQVGVHSTPRDSFFVREKKMIAFV